MAETWASTRALLAHVSGACRAEPLGSYSPSSVLPAASALSFPGPSCWHTICYSWASQELFTSDNSVHLAIPAHVQGQSGPPSPVLANAGHSHRQRWPRHSVNVIIFQPHRYPPLLKEETEVDRRTCGWSRCKDVAELGVEPGPSD